MDQFVWHLFCKLDCKQCQCLVTIYREFVIQRKFLCGCQNIATAARNIIWAKIWLSQTITLLFHNSIVHRTPAPLLYAFNAMFFCSCTKLPLSCVGKTPLGLLEVSSEWCGRGMYYILYVISQHLHMEFTLYTFFATDSGAWNQNNGRRSRYYGLLMLPRECWNAFSIINYFLPSS